MSDSAREQILADFIECTGLENMEECIMILEQNHWNLLNAVQVVHDRLGSGNDTRNESTVPKHTTTSKTSSIAKKPNNTSGHNRLHSDSDDNNDTDDLHIIKSLPGAPKTIKTTSGAASRGQARELRFNVEYKDHTETITMLDNETILQLKIKIADKLNVIPNRQRFSNWSQKRFDDHTTLRDLHLPRDNEIHLIAAVAPISNGGARSTITTAPASNRPVRHPTSPTKHSSTNTIHYFPITVLYEEKPGKSTPYELVLKPSTTIREMKHEIERSAHLPIDQQHWTGLFGASDSDQLRQTQIRSKANLIVRKIDSSSNQKLPTNKPNRSTIVKHLSEDDAMDVDQVIDLESFDDDIPAVHPHFSATASATTTKSNREPLIPDRCPDEMTGLEQFTRVFHSRYGSTGPILYIGTLDQAIQDSLFTSRTERRPLAIYLHNDRSVCANVFCAQVLASDTIVEYLANNYVVWAWDITTDANRTRLLESFKRCLGYQYAQRIASMEKEAFPLILICVRSRGSVELTSTIEGKNTSSEVLLNLIQSHEMFEQQRKRDEEEEISRELRENLKKQQEDEYNRSLQADLAKEEARIADERRQQEEQNAQERLKKKHLQQQEECKARLPEEPADTEKDITRLKIRLPDDEGILMRRFRIRDPLQILFDYLTSKGRMFGEYKLLSTFPKRDLTTLNRSDTFEQLKLYPQEQLILETL